MDAPTLRPNVLPVGMSSGKLEALWQQLLAKVRDRRPLIVSWIEPLRPLALHNGVLKIGFEQDRSIAAESLRRPNNLKLLEELASEVVGERIEIELTAL
jgi:hypothetical protein